MKKGAYLKENRSSHIHNSSNQASLEDRQQRKAMRLRQKKRRKLISLGVGILMCLLVVFVVINSNVSPLVGKWYMDDVTAYEFYNSSKGAMVLPSAEYKFTYTIKDNTLNIDFDYEAAKDAKYTFVIDGDILTLEGGNATNQGIYVLHKKK